MSPEDTDILAVVLYSVFSVLVLFSNSIVIIVIIKSRELHLPTLWNIAVMAALDFALGASIIVFVVPSKSMQAFAYPDVYGGISAMLMLFIITQKALNILLALVDRYISICCPLHYPRLMSPKRFTFATAIILCISIARVSVLASTDGAWCYNKLLGFHIQEQPSLVRSLSRLIVFVIALIIVGLLVRIRVELGKSKGYGNAVNPQSASAQFTYTMHLSTLVYIVCYIPITIIILVRNLTQEELVLWVQIGLTCLVSNSLWNVFIYAATYRPFRDAFLKLFCPTYYRGRARREVQAYFQRSRVVLFTVI